MPSRHRLVVLSFVRLAVGLGVVALGVVALNVVKSMRGGFAPEPVAGSPSVAVLPLRNLSPDPAESDYLAEGITQAVITRLTRTGIRVTPWETARTFRDSRVPADQLARQLNVSAVLVGTFQLQGDRLLTTLSLVDAESGLQSWTDEFEEPYEDLFGVQRRIAVGVATSLSRELASGEVAALESPEARSVEAYDAYLQGAYLMQDETRESTEVALQYFARALELDPTLAEAHVGVAATHLESYTAGWGGSPSNLEQAQASFEAALRLDPSSTRARRGLVSIQWFRGFGEPALIQGQEAGRFSTREDVETLLAKAHAYVFGGLTEEGLRLARRTMELDPLNQLAPFLIVTAGVRSAASLRDVIEVGEAYINRFGEDAHLLTQMGRAHDLLGHHGQAREHYARAFEIGSQQRHGLYLARAALYRGGLLARLGQTDRADDAWRAGLEQLVDILADDPGNAGLRLFLATLHGFLGDSAALEAEEARAFESVDFVPWQTIFVAAAHGALGESDRAVELMRRLLRQGGAAVFWTQNLDALVPSLSRSPAFAEFRKEHAESVSRLRQRYVDGP